MLKRINWKAILIGFTWAVCLGGLVTLMSFIETEKSDTVCKDVKVLIPGNQNFVEREEVDRILLENSGKLVGKQLSHINIQHLEKVLKANPFIEFAKVYADMDGVIQVQIRQREPVLRILNSTGQDFYVDFKGNKIPTSENFTADVLVANGNIREVFSGRVDTMKTKLARDLFNTASFIAQDTLWSNQIQQLYVNHKSEIELVPRVGNQRIILGSADSLQRKFKNLEMFYKKALPKVGWDTYKTINIKYTNQVIGEKNITDSLKSAATINSKIIAIEPSKADSSKNTIQDTQKINAF